MPHRTKKIDTTRVMGNIVVNAGFWIMVGLALLLLQPLSWSLSVSKSFWIGQTLLWMMLVVIYYVNGIWVVPRLLFRNRFFIFSIWIIVAITAFVILGNTVHQVFQNHTFPVGRMPVPPHDGHPFPPPMPMDRPRLPVPKGPNMFMVMLGFMVLGISTSVALFARWNLDNQQRAELEKENIRSELSFLKAQINPHFFFNTLNNIYSLTYIDTEASRKSLLMLSRMMRYLLYETRQDKTPVRREVEFIEHYVELMKIRLGEHTAVVLQKPDELPDESIAPMLLLPFVENAFKHGISNGNLNFIGIYIYCNDARFEMKVENTIGKRAAEHSKEQAHSGIGIQNTRRRLALLYPGDKHHLFTGYNEQTDRFVVDLKLQLN